MRKHNEKKEVYPACREASGQNQKRPSRECKQKISKAQKQHKGAAGNEKTVKGQRRARYPANILPASCYMTRNGAGLEASIAEIAAAGRAGTPTS